MASRNFTNLAAHYANGRIDYGSDTFKAILVDSVPSETQLDTWDFRNDVTNEVAAGGGYSAGGFPVTVSVGAVDSANDRVAVTFSAPNPTYSNATISARGCIIYKSTGTAASDPIITFVDFNQLVSSTNGNFTVSFSTPHYINANP